MRHSKFRNMWEALLEDSEEWFIESNSKHCALISLRDGSTFFIRGDFSGTRKEREAEARRILKDIKHKGNRAA